MSAQVHRFRDTVAAWLGTGATVYMTPDRARALGEALVQFADDVEAVKFQDSQLPTFNLSFDDED